MCRVKTNSKAYWNRRFSGDDWGEAGRRQTAQFAQSLIPHLHMAPDFSGTILDFGCATGDAFPIYHEAFPSATLVGVDISTAAIERARSEFGHLGQFIVGDHQRAPAVDVIVASHVMEHIPNDEEVARNLLSKCNHLYIVTPYRETDLIPEHLRSYDETSFHSLNPSWCRIYRSPGWGAGGSRLIDVHIKNVARIVLGRKPARIKKVIAFYFCAKGLNRPAGSLRRSRE